MGAIAAILFSVTGGYVQMSSGLYRYCGPATNIPDNLDPPPPAGPNFARVCRVSFFGAPTSGTLIVGRTTREGSATRSIYRTYMLDKNANLIKGFSIDWLVTVLGLAYLVTLTSRTGQTLGDRALGIRVVDTSQPALFDVPAKKVVIRYLAMAIGAVPPFAFFLYRYAVGGGDPDAMFATTTIPEFVFAYLLAATWILLLVLQIAFKTDPVYDRLAGTAMIRD
jgi:uncharacterized RDD family membrane protein YckC